jgi:sugar transferase (PEP-CTERM/EpsH1 system associated)
LHIDNPAPLTDASKPLVAHVVYRFDVGGLENGVVNLVNRMTDWRHVVIALTEAVPAFCSRVTNPEVSFVSLQKGPGHGVKLYPAMLRELRRLRPQAVHTRNLAALEMQVPAWWAGVPLRVHGEHGRDAHDVDGTMRRYQWLRRAYRPFVHQWVALSRDLALYLEDAVGVPHRRITQIYNGVDPERFVPVPTRLPIGGCPFVEPGLCLAGTVGRMQTVKAQPLLVKAFIRALDLQPHLRDNLRLVLVGDGSLRAECEALLAQAKVQHLAWLAGERNNIPRVMQGLDLFVLPSLAEGISNTVLEAMASGLPVVATNVGGNADLVADGHTGCIVPAGDVEALAQALARFAADANLRRSAGKHGRAVVEQRFGMPAMVGAYRQVYASVAGQPI